MIRRGTFCFLLCACVMFGQASNSNSITVTATRTPNTQPDQVVLRVAVDGPLTSTLDDAVNALQGSGVTSANFSGVTETQQYGGNTGPQNYLEWTFSLTVAISNVKSTIGQLSAVQQSNAQKNSALTISFSVQGTQASPQAQQAQACSLTDLLSDAKTQATKMASAAGKGLGTVIAMSSATSSTGVTGLFSTPATVPNCSLTVKFQLTGF